MSRPIRPYSSPRDSTQQKIHFVDSFVVICNTVKRVTHNGGGSSKSSRAKLDKCETCETFSPYRTQGGNRRPSNPFAALKSPGENSPVLRLCTERARLFVTSPLPRPPRCLTPPRAKDTPPLSYNTPRTCRGSEAPETLRARTRTRRPRRGQRSRPLRSLSPSPPVPKRLLGRDQSRPSPCEVHRARRAASETLPRTARVRRRSLG